MADDKGLVRQVLLRWALAKRRELVAEQWWCRRCQALRGAAELEADECHAESSDISVGRRCRECGATVEELPF